jgi:hypothetical protein
MAGVSSALVEGSSRTSLAASAAAEDSGAPTTPVGPDASCPVATALGASSTLVGSAVLVEAAATSAADSEASTPDSSDPTRPTSAPAQLRRRPCHCPAGQGRQDR